MELMALNQEDNSKRATIESEILELYNQCLVYINDDIQRYSDTLYKAYQLSKEINYSYGLEYFKAFKANNEKYKRNYAETINLFDEAMITFARCDNVKMVAFCLNGKGSVYYEFMDYKNAYDCFKNALELCKTQRDYKRLGIIYNNLVILLEDMERYTEEIHVLLEALDILKDKAGDQDYLINNIRLAHVYHRTEEYTKASNSLNNIKSKIDHNDDQLIATFYHIELGRVKIHEGLLEAGLVSLFKGIKLADKVKDYDLLALGYYYIQLYYLDKKDINNRVLYLDKAYEIASLNQYSYIVESSLKELIGIYKARYDFKSATETLEKLHQYKLDEYKRERDIKLESLIIDAKLQNLKEKNIELLNVASIDELTGVYNRRFLLRHIDELSSRLTYSVLIIDVDNFKVVNDSYGHLTGDMVLKGIVNEIKAVMKGNGIIGRYGGDEFIVILYEKELAPLRKLVDEIKVRINNLVVDDCSDISISGGLVRDVNREEIEKALLSADLLLYDVKMETKNDIFIA